MRRIVHLFLFAILFSTIGTSLWMVWRLNISSHQLNNLERGRSLVRLIEGYKDRNRTYPARLEQLLPASSNAAYNDAWGNRFQYETTGTAFILVSLGQDGRPDGTNHWKQRDVRLTTYEAPKSAWNICGNPDADQVMSDLGEHRICGK